MAIKFLNNIETSVGSIGVKSSEAALSPLLDLHNTNPGAGATIRFTDQAIPTQFGFLTYFHVDASSQGGGNAFVFTGQPDTVLQVGNADVSGRVVVKSHASVAEVDYGFYDDLNTGMYRVTADTLSLVTAGTQRIVIDPDGEVGIGTDTPTAKLHVQGASATEVPIVRIGGFGNSGSKLELAETLSGADMNYGFSFFNDGNSSNTLIVKAHNNSTTGVTAFSISRTTALTTFNVNPVVGTRAAGDNSTRAASTAFVTAAVAAVSGDITAVTAGTGLTGGGTSGAVTLNAIGGDGITANANDIQVDSTVVRTTGSTMTGTLDFSGSGIGRAITITADSGLDGADASIYLGNAPASYGWDIQYTGTGSGNTNSLDIISTNAGSPVTALKILQDGTTTFSSDAVFEENVQVDGEIVQTSSGGENQFASPLNMGSNEIADLADPTAAQDAATKAYVDNAVSGVSSGVTSVATTNGITGGTITSTGTIQLDSTVVRTSGTQTIAGEKTFTNQLAVDTAGGSERMRLFNENNTAPIADSFSGNTSKSYIYFDTVSGSNDPGYIMHESSATETNEGVLHLVPSDDNGNGDYVSIHGTNDPDILKLHTSGLIETLNLQLELKSGSGSIYLNDGVAIAADLTVSGGDITLGGTGRIQGIDTVSASTDAANKAYVDNAVYTPPTAPAASTTVTTAVVGETIEVTFNESATSDIDYYQVWSADPSGNFGIIAQIAPGDFASTMTVVDTSFNVSGTISYRVYAVKLGIYSTAATSTQVFLASALSVTAMTVVNLNTAYYVQYEKPSSRFINNIEIYMDSQATQAALNRSNASIVYSGQNASYMRNVGASNNFHQFWVEVTTT